VPDTDADGASDGAEVAAGTDPLVPDQDPGDPPDTDPPDDTDLPTDGRDPVETASGPAAEGCGCAQAPTPAGTWLALGLGAVVRRSRRRSRTRVPASR
jgi:MYXO-CTERM domain-containing protein